MPVYWWECEICGERSDFPKSVCISSMSRFIWDKLEEFFVVTTAQMFCFLPQNIPLEKNA